MEETLTFTLSLNIFVGGRKNLQHTRGKARYKIDTQKALKEGN